METIHHPDIQEQPVNSARTPKYGSDSPTVQIAFRAPRDVRRRLQIIAAATERAFATVCTEALSQYLERNEVGPSVRDVRGRQEAGR